MAEEELELDVNQSKGSKMTTILLIVLIVLVLIVGGIGAWYFLVKGDSGASGSAESTEKVLGPLQYHKMIPEFVVNFGPDSKARYLQVDLEISTRDAEAVKVVETYRPVLRNDILVILSGTTFEQLKSRDGKEVLQKKLLNSINKVVAEHVAGYEKKNTNKETMSADVNGPIENVYFTSFIMQ